MVFSHKTFRIAIIRLFIFYNFLFLSIKILLSLIYYLDYKGDSEYFPTRNYQNNPT